MKRIHILRFLIAVLVIELGVIAVGITLDTALAGSSYTGSTPVFNADELFTERDLEQTPDLSKAVYYTVTDGTDIHITEKGVYVIRGTAKNVTVFVEAADDAKVQLVLDGVNITTANFPCIYVKTGDKVFINTVNDSALSVTGTFAAYGATQTDGVIFSRQDLVLNGTAALTVSSTYNGIVCKDDLKITGGSYTVTATSKAIQANDSIRISDGTFYLTAGTDALHSENDEDDSKGYIYIGGGTFTIRAGDDGIRAQTVVQIDDGDIRITASEGIEATYIQINGGTLYIQATDDGINGANKSRAYQIAIVINGGDITVVMGSGDTDGIDSNGDIIVNGGTINVTGNSSFDYDGTAEYNGGTIIVNGQQVSYIPNQFMGGGMFGRGGWGAKGGWGGR
ncbi:MAG: carbohydrate-binding domain-containing protein [Clostridia bacterium]|nr:carbohydrate-binding domain-containing protein [Clostridia bacterium]